MQHTYFLKNLDWQASGIYYDKNGKAFDLSGNVKIVHDEIEWTLTGFMQVAYKNPVRFMNDYVFSNTECESTFQWQSYNPAIGTLNGKLEVIGDHIISSYTSQDGDYHGMETLIQIDENTYDNVGVTYLDGKKISSWTATLKVVN